MKEPLAAIERTRELSAGIVAQCLRDIDGKSEEAVRDEILAAMQAAPEIYERGWYDPPPFGVSVLFGNGGYERLQYDSLRNKKYFPRDDVFFSNETVAQLYLSPVDRATGLLGDLDCSIYRGVNAQIRSHLKETRDIILAIADHAKAGIQFCELFAFAQTLFTEHKKVIGWMSTLHDTMSVNLGHTVPCSYEGSVSASLPDDVVERIGKGRVFINAKEEFAIPSTCAFTVEARLTDSTRVLPNVCFHVIVCFSGGEKTVLTNFDGVFKAAGMDYML